MLKIIANTIEAQKTDSEKFATLKVAEKIVKDSLASLKSSVIETAQTVKADAKGSYKLVVGGADVQYVSKDKKEIDTIAALELLKEKQLEHIATASLKVKNDVDTKEAIEALEKLSQYFDIEKTIAKTDLEKVLVKDEIESVTTVTTSMALIVKPTGELKATLQG
jgi:hypothetical protein